MASREEILGRYFQTYQSNPDITPTEFMLAANPGSHRVVYKGRPFYTSYSSADSARRQFTKLQKGETSGERMIKRGEKFTRLGPEGTGFRLVEPKGGYEQGLWKVVVHMNWTDADGKEHVDEERSFVVRSSSLNSYYDASRVEAEVGDAIEDHVASWEDDYGVGEVEIVYVEVIRIQTTSKTSQYIVSIE